MKYSGLRKHLLERLKNLKNEGLYTKEQVLTSEPSTKVSTTQHKSLLNFSSCNYLGYADDARLTQYASGILDQYGVGLSSVRFICGTTQHHIELENKISKFFEKDDTILFANGYSANMALFETFFTKEDVIILDKKVHESLRESADLTHASRYYFAHNDIKELEECLKKADETGARFKVIAFDGLSASTGEVAKINEICDLADKYKAIVLVDECHSFGILGEKGRGASELENALHRVDLISGTFSKAVGGCNGGFLTGNKDIIDLLRQKGRPYLFSNTIPQFVGGTYLYVLDLLEKESERRSNLIKNAKFLRSKLTEMGLNITGHPNSPIIPIVLGDEKLARGVSDDLAKNGVLALPLLYPYHPKGEAVIRIQVSTSHSNSELIECSKAIQKTFTTLGLIE